MNKPLPVQQYIPQQTIQSYLDALLQDASSELLLAEQAPVEVQQDEALAQPTAEALDTPTPQVEPEPAAPAVQKRSRIADRMIGQRRPARAETPPAQVEEQSLVAAVEPDAEPAKATSPLWREQEFEALLFDVAGLTLAVPLVSLGTIHALEAEITPLFGQPDWFLGILPTVGGNLKVLDTAKWVMPERYTDALQEGLRFVISVQGYDWGLAVHGVSRSIKLTPDQVKWRSQQGKRPWLAGTVIDQMCALVDVAALAEMIATGQGEHEKRKGKSGRALV